MWDSLFCPKEQIHGETLTFKRVGMQLKPQYRSIHLLRIHQSKSGKENLLPLLAPVGNALLDYVQNARPKTVVREVFVCAYAPHRPLSSLHYIVSRVLDEAGIDASGRRGPHAFRHARAVSLLRQRVSLKAISDILGHRSALQTRTYLKLATEDLRDVALELPATTETTL